MDKIAVLIPCYNEAKTISKVVADFQAALPEAVIYVYDNNSTDGTAALAKAAGAVVRRERRQGKGNVVRRMFREIDAACYVMADGDDTYPAEAAPQLVREVMENGADMVVGDRLSSTYFTENQRPFHNTGNRLVLKSVNTIFHSDIKDIMTGYRAFSYQFVKSFPVRSRGFEIETEMSIFAADRSMQLSNVVVQYRDRPEGSESKLNTVSDGIRVLLMIGRLFRTYRPLAFYTAASGLMALLSAAFLAPVLADYARTGQVPRFPTLIVCGFVIMGAMLTFFAGVILHTIRDQELRSFEGRLHDIHAQQVLLSSDRPAAGGSSFRS